MTSIFCLLISSCRSYYGVFAFTLNFDGEVLPTGSTLYCKDRTTHGGGVLLAIYHSLPSRQFEAPSNLEIVTVQLTIMGSTLICVVYIPPN